MSVNVPTNVWRRTSGNGELGTTDLTLTTLNDDQLVTLSGLLLIALPGSYTATPASEWSNGTETLPASVWRTTSGNNDSAADGPSDLVDTAGDFIVDTSGDQVIDTGITMDIIPDTIWEEDNSI